MSAKLAAICRHGADGRRLRGGDERGTGAAGGVRQPEAGGIEAAAAADVDGMREMTQQMVDQIFSYAELGYQEIETSKYLTERSGEERLPDRAQHRRHADRMDGDVGIGPAGDRAGIRPRRYPAGVAEAGRRLPRSDRRRRARPRGRAQFRDAAAGHRGAGGEEDHGARAPAGNAEALARRRRGARRREGLLRARRRVQGRRHLSVRARRQQFQRVVRRSSRDRAWCRSSTRSPARARMRRRIRGAAVRRSTPWS